MRLNRGNLGKVFDAAAGAQPGEPAALLGLRKFLQFLSDVAVVPRLLAPAEVAANVVSDATTGQRARDGWKISFNEFILRICRVADIVFERQHRSGTARQRALLEYLAPPCERLYGVTLELQVPADTSAAPPPYKPSSLVHCDGSPPLSPSRTSLGVSDADLLVHKLQQRLADAERQLRSERKARDAVTLRADQACAAMEEELTRLRAQSASARQQEQVVRALSPRGLRRKTHGRAVLGALAVGIIARSRINATAGWFQLWVSRVRESKMQRTVMIDRQRADTAVQEAEQALTSLTLREERQQNRSHPAPIEMRNRDRGRMQSGPAYDAELAVSAAQQEAEAWRRRADGEAKARAMAKQEQDALRDALEASQIVAARVERAERDAQKAAAECALVEKQLRSQVELNTRREAEAARELASVRESAESSHLPVVTALQEVSAELRQALRACERTLERQLLVSYRIAGKSAHRWQMWRAFSRWRTLAFICEAKAAAGQQRVLLVAVLLHQRQRAHLRRKAFRAWSNMVRAVLYE